MARVYVLSCYLSWLDSHAGRSLLEVIIEVLVIITTTVRLKLEIVVHFFFLSVS